MQVLLGGSAIALIAVIRGITVWGIPYWFFYLVAIPFIFLAAITQRLRVHILILFIFLMAHAWVSQGEGTRIGLADSDLVEWGIVLIAGEVVFQISSQSRRANEVTRQRITELEVMNETLTKISGDLELHTLLQTIVERAVDLLDVSLGELLLYDRQTGEMEIVAQYPSEPNQIGFKMKPGQGAMGRVAVTKKPLILNDYKAFVNSLPEDITTGVECTLDIPLLKGDEFIGVLGVARHTKNHRFSLDDQSLLTVFASQATVAIENARLYKEVQNLAFTDVLTGINNRRRFFDLAEGEFKRSERYNRPLSFMIADIDHFKKINDNYGHTAGDDVLRWFARECSLVIRKEVDVIGRFGGEEFSFIYPETDRASAVSAAERLRKRIRDKRVFLPEHDLQITFSSGVASMPSTGGVGLDQLIERADKALYHAKIKRNCTAYWDDDTGAPANINR